MLQWVFGVLVLFLFVWIMNLLLESSDSGWNLFLPSKAYLLVGQYILEWILILVLFMSVSEFCLVVLGFFSLLCIYSSKFVVIHNKGFSSLPTSFPCALGRASSIGILQMILYTHHVVKCSIIYIKPCQQL